MADLDFKHHVSEVPRGEQLPETFRRTVKPEESSVPNFQAAYQEFGSATNWLSAIGSAIATRSSNALASKLGGELGKNPQGNIGISFTEFDQQLEKSYATQAQSTLGIQAQTLISKSNLELAQKPRLTPEMISSTQEQLDQGLQKILALAPDSVKPNMEQHYNSIRINQYASLVERMLGEQKEDRKDTLAVSNKLALQNIHSLAMANDDKGALAALKSIESANASAYGMRDISKAAQQDASDTARQTYLSGKMSREATKAAQENRLPQFMKDLAENKFGIADKDHAAVYNNVRSTIQEQIDLRAQNNNLIAAKFSDRMATDLGNISNTDVQNVMSQLPPIQATNLLIDYHKALNKAAKDHANLSFAIENYQKPDEFSQLPDKVKKEVLANQTVQYIKDQSAVGNNVTPAEAEMHIAALAGGTIPSYITKLNSKAESGNPVSLQEVSAAIDYIGRDYDKGNNLRGLSDNAKVMVGMFNAFKDSHDPITAAQIAKEVVFNKDPKIQEAAEQQYANYVKNKKSSGQSDASFALSIAGIDRDSLVDIPYLSEYVKDKFKGYYIITKGNEDVASQLTKADIDSTFGYTNINGKKQFTHLPINKTYNLPDDANGLIHQDVSDQIQKQFESTKKLYDSGHSDFYWMVEPQPTFDQVHNAMLKQGEKFNPNKPEYKTNGIYDSKKIAQAKVAFEKEQVSNQKMIERYKFGGPPKVIQHFRDGGSHKYELNIQAGVNLGKNKQGAMVGAYDVNIKVGKSIQSIAQADPAAGHFKYTPNTNDIINKYHKLFPLIAKAPSNIPLRLRVLSKL